MITLQFSKPIDIYLPNVYRYLDKEYINLFFEKGILRLSSFKRFKDYPDEIRGDKKEGNGSVAGVSIDTKFTLKIETNVGANAYMLCGSTIESENLKRLFKTKSCFRIVRPLEFSVAVSNAITGFIQSFQGYCNYRDEKTISKTISDLSFNDFKGPNNSIHITAEKFNERSNQIIGNGIDLMFLKEKSYQEQSEYRFIWSVNSDFYKIHDYIDIECKEAIQFCEKLD